MQHLKKDGDIFKKKTDTVTRSRREKDGGGGSSCEMKIFWEAIYRMRLIDSWLCGEVRGEPASSCVVQTMRSKSDGAEWVVHSLAAKLAQHLLQSPTPFRSQPEHKDYQMKSLMLKFSYWKKYESVLRQLCTLAFLWIRAAEYWI